MLGAYARKHPISRCDALWTFNKDLDEEWPHHDYEKLSRHLANSNRCHTSCPVEVHTHITTPCVKSGKPSLLTSSKAVPLASMCGSLFPILFPSFMMFDLSLLNQLGTTCFFYQLCWILLVLQVNKFIDVIVAGSFDLDSMQRCV